MIALFLACLAYAEELHPVRAGDTIETIAAARGAKPDELRALNDLSAGEQPAVGSLLRLPPPPGFSSDQQAFLIALTGEATLTDTNGVTEAARTFEPIDEGTTICTAARGIATLRLASTCNDDGSTSDDIVLNPQTCLEVRSSVSTQQGRSTVVQVTRGAVSVATRDQADGHVTIVTPSGITTGTSGGYRVAIEDEAARTEAIGAPVAVAAQGEEVALDRGQGSRTRTGEAPGPPVDLLPAPQPLLPDAGAVLGRPRFSWQPADQAFAYRFELATGQTFLQTLYIEDIAEPAYRPGMLLLPTDATDTLYWRVSVFDRLGFQGMPSAPRAFVLPSAVLR